MNSRGTQNGPIHVGSVRLRTLSHESEDVEDWLIAEEELREDEELREEPLPAELTDEELIADEELVCVLLLAELTDDAELLVFEEEDLDDFAWP